MTKGQSFSSNYRLVFLKRLRFLNVRYNLRSERLDTCKTQTSTPDQYSEGCIEDDHLAPTTPSPQPKKSRHLLSPPRSGNNTLRNPPRLASPLPESPPQPVPTAAPRRLPSFRIIDCMHRFIIPAPARQLAYAALSYVWGPCLEQESPRRKVFPSWSWTGWVGELSVESWSLVVSMSMPEDVMAKIRFEVAKDGVGAADSVQVNVVDGSNRDSREFVRVDELRRNGMVDQSTYFRLTKYVPKLPRALWRLSWYRRYHTLFSGENRR